MWEGKASWEIAERNVKGCELSLLIFPLFLSLELCLLTPVK